jgi:hypothetical protein
MAINPRKNKVLISMWLEKDEMKELSNALENNDKESILNVIFESYYRGDLL